MNVNTEDIGEWATKLIDKNKALRAESRRLRKALKILATADPRAWTVELMADGAREALKVKESK